MPGLRRRRCHHDKDNVAVWTLLLLPQHVALPLVVNTKWAENKYRAYAAPAATTTTSM
jgi:hypothetical protein